MSLLFRVIPCLKNQNIGKVKMAYFGENVIDRLRENNAPVVLRVCEHPFKTSVPRGGKREREREHDDDAI